MTSSQLSLIERAASLTSERSDLPDSSQVVESLLYLEKLAKKEKIDYSFSDLIGSWKLRFITGTKKTRKRAGIVLGAGRYIPQLIQIQIRYEPDPDGNSDTGRVQNSVRLAFLVFSLTGPVKFLKPKNILAFDFTAMTIKVFGLKIYDGYIFNGANREQEFYQTKISQQAFFSYFLITEKLIVARGRGGGLALWVKNIADDK